MKKFLCLLTAILCFLCSCSQENQPTQLNSETFSYKEVSEYYDYYKNEPGIQTSDFVNNTKNKIKNTEQAVELAKKECTVEYDTIKIDFDEKERIYRVVFYKMDYLGGNQDIYINEDGITQLIVFGE